MYLWWSYYLLNENMLEYVNEMRPQPREGSKTKEKHLYSRRISELNLKIIEGEDLEWNT